VTHKEHKVNSYKFVLQYDNNGDARDGAKLLKAHLAANGSPNAAQSVKYVGSTVELEIAGNVSAATFAGMLEGIDAVYTVTPVGDSQPLPTVYILY